MHKLFSKTILVLSIFTSINNAHALDPSASVKVTPILNASTSWNGVPIAYPSGTPQITGQLVEILPQGETAWHEHPVPSFGMILEGTLEVSLLDGTKKVLKAGDSVVEVVNTPHRGKNIGEGSVKLLVFYAGVISVPTTVKHVDESGKTAVVGVPK